MANSPENKLGTTSSGALRAIAKARLAEFLFLKEAHPITAVYLAGYAVEALLKCAICRRLGTDKLPIVFYFHDLKVLLYFSGLKDDLEREENADVNTSFRSIAEIWSEKLRYEEIPSQRVNDSTCKNFDTWLNGYKNEKGELVGAVVPWLESRIQ